MKINPSFGSRCGGYTLIEVCLASALICVGVGAAASLSMNLDKIEQINQRQARVLALAEGGARLWQLGLDTTTVNALLLSDPAAANTQTSVTFVTVGNVNVANRKSASTNLGVFERANIKASCKSRDGDGGSDAGQVRDTIQFTVLR